MLSWLPSFIARSETKLLDAIGAVVGTVGAATATAGEDVAAIAPAGSSNVAAGGDAPLEPSTVVADNKRARAGAKRAKTSAPQYLQNE